MTRGIGLITGAVIIILLACRVVSHVSWADAVLPRADPDFLMHAATLRAGVADLQTFSLNVRDCGAVGDGVVDDTTALQAASDVIGTAGGGTLYIPKGNYLLSSTVMLPSNLHVVGDGNGSRVFTTTDNINLFSATNKSDIVIEKLQLNGHNTSSAITNGNGLYFDSCRKVTIRDCSLHHFGTVGGNVGGTGDSSAILFYQDCNDVTVEDCYIDGGGGSAGASDFCLYSNVTRFLIRGNRCYSTNSQGIFVMAVNGQEGIVTGSISKNHARHGIQTYSAATDNHKRLIVSNNYCSDNGWTGIYITGTGGGVPSDDGYVLVEGNYCKGNGTVSGVLVADYSLNGPINVLLTGNISESAVWRGIYVNDLKKGQITNNRIISPASDGIYLYQLGDDILVADNFISNAMGHGIYMTMGEAANRIRVDRNVIIDPNHDGILYNAYDGTGGSICDNRLYRSETLNAHPVDANGIYVLNASQVLISGNQIDGFYAGLHFGGNVDLVGSSITDNQIQNCARGIWYYCCNAKFVMNQFINNTTNYYAEGGSGNTWTEVSHFSRTCDPNSLPDGAKDILMVACPGAAVGDICMVSFDQITAGGWILQAHVIRANTVAVTFVNHTGSESNLASGIIRVDVWKQ